MITASKLWNRILAVILLATLSFAQDAVHEQIIAVQGQRLPSLFEGLKPSSFAKASTERTAKQASRVGPAGTECTTCPFAVCAGHYEKIVVGTGCTDPVACTPPLHIAVSDTITQHFRDGSVPTYCGATCCLDAENCDNP